MIEQRTNEILQSFAGLKVAQAQSAAAREASGMDSLEEPSATVEADTSATPQAVLLAPLVRYPGRHDGPDGARRPRGVPGHPLPRNKRQPFKRASGRDGVRARVHLVDCAQRRLHIAH